MFQFYYQSQSAIDCLITVQSLLKKTRFLKNYFLQSSLLIEFLLPKNRVVFYLNHMHWKSVCLLHHYCDTGLWQLWNYLVYTFQMTEPGSFYYLDDTVLRRRLECTYAEVKYKVKYKLQRFVGIEWQKTLFKVFSILFFKFVFYLHNTGDISFHVLLFERSCEAIPQNNHYELHNHNISYCLYNFNITSIFSIIFLSSIHYLQTNKQAVEFSL